MTAKKSIPEIQLFVIRAIGKAKTIARRDLCAQVAAKYHLLDGQADNHVARCKTHGYIKTTPGGNSKGVLVQLTAKGSAILKKASEYTVKPYKPMPRSKPAQPDSNQPAPINISHTANAVADSITDLIAENNAYRDLMLRTANTIAAALGMEIAEKISGDTE